MVLIQLPPLEEKGRTATVVRWLKAPGDPVAQGDLLVELESELARVEIESAVTGRLTEILAQGRSTVAVGSDLCRIEITGDKSAEARRDMSAEKRKPVENKSPESGAAPIASAGNVVPVLMPQAGQSMEEGTIVEWRVKVGDRIEKGQAIFDVETDKATVEVEADHTGRIARIVVPAGETVAVKVPVAYLAENDSDVDAYLGAQESTSPLSPPSPAPAPSPVPQIASGSSALKEPAPVSEGGRIKASPAARKLAAEKGVDLAVVGAGHGPGGRILSDDVVQAKASGATLVAAAPAGATTRKRMSGMRRAIARNLTTSKQTIPHFYMCATVDAESLMRAYAERKNRFKCSLNDFIVSACARAIQEFPAFRSRLDGDDIVEFPTANVGIAVGLDNGLVVPVVVGADRMAFEQLATETRRVVDAARTGRIEGSGQGVFTITNLGMFGVEEFSAIINPPEAAILAVGAVREEVIVKDGAIRPGRVMTMTLSCDHRLIDGLLAARFCARLKELLESPETL